MSRDGVLRAAVELTVRDPRLPFIPDMDSLTPAEIEKLVAACVDADNPAVRNLFTYSGARTVTRIIARMTIVSPENRAVLIELIRRAIAEHDDRTQ